MVDKTLSALITDCQDEIYQVSGIGTQVYTQDLIRKRIIDAFFLIATDPTRKWKRFRKLMSYTLDGTTGHTTVAVSSTFTSFDDILAVYPDGSDLPLASAGMTRNSLLLTGTRPVQYTVGDTDTIKVYPVAAEGDIVVLGRSILQTTFNLNDTVPFDYLAIKHFVCWQYITDDGSNPGQAEKHRILYEGRIKQLKEGQEEDPIPLDGVGAARVPSNWWSDF